MREFDAFSGTKKPRDHVLVLVVRKLDRELQSCRGVSKCVTNCFPRSGLFVTDGTDLRPRASEELTPVTTNTCVMVRKIYDVRNLGKPGPLFSWNDVTRFALGLMLLRRVGKLRVIDLSNTDNRN
jgi:hypothetical protein